MEVNIEGVRTIIRIYNEMNPTLKPLSSPAKYVDTSYLKEALRGERP
jgi:hypothetical protein